MKRSLAALFAALLLASCSSGGTASDEPANPDAGLPDCENIWVEGDTLPDDYEDCAVDGSSAAAATDCPGNGKSLATWDIYWAHAGEEIQAFDPDFADDPDGDPAFQAAFKACTSG